MYPAHEGQITAEFLSTEEEILKDLYAVCQAVQLKPVSLTKSGIPPKPLWNAINQRLVWADPDEVMYDWEEVDQVRFTYALALELNLVGPDEEGWLKIDSGADAFFLTDSVNRAKLLRRAYINLFDWDERSDARNDKGHRYQFGKAYRREFVFGVSMLREAALETLENLGEKWTHTTHAAVELSESAPELLISDSCELPEIGGEGFDPEKLRFVNYFFSLLGRFGWVDIARAPGESPDHRLVRLTPVGNGLIHGSAVAKTANPSFSIDEELTLELSGESVSIADEFVGHRIGTALPTRRDAERKIFHVTAESLQRALESGADLRLALEYLKSRLPGALPARLSQQVEDLIGGFNDITYVRRACALEVDREDRATLENMTQAGFVVSGRLCVAAGPRVGKLLDRTKGEPEDGFHYPTDIPLAQWVKSTGALKLLWEELPLQHRDLILQLFEEGGPVEFTEKNLAPLKDDGWTASTLLGALGELTLKSPPDAVKKLIKRVLA
ncbi:MAG: hypothetical protein KC561_05205 [Myxococcales bacterium]|nr:hypothetical protein [Myxococcales bacterium]